MFGDGVAGNRERVVACLTGLRDDPPRLEMDHAHADWQLIMYGGAMHGFTHEHATPGAIPGVAYDALADRRSFAATLAFLAEALAPTAPHPGTARSTR
jgi:dienelactone hydrolase